MATNVVSRNDKHPNGLKTNIDLLNDCDMLAAYPPSLYKFLVDDFEGAFGYMQESIVKQFSWNRWGDKWKVDHDARSVRLLAQDMEERNNILHKTLTHERDQGTFKLLTKWSGEVFPVYGPKKELVLSVEKVAAPLFGVATYGVQLLAYQDSPEGPKVWIARRAETKRRFPGMLDSTVGGSLPTGETPFECLVRESEEEASFPPDFTTKYARSVGLINYVYLFEDRSGGETGCLSPEVQFCYEMKLPEQMIPVPRDKEVEVFELMDVAQINEALGKGEFTPANGCVMLDFFIRHGIITFENEPHYIEIASRLRRDLHLQTA